MSQTQVLITAVGVLLCGAVLATMLRAQRPELAVSLSLIAGVLVLGLVLGQMAPFVRSLQGMLAVGGLPSDSLTLVLKGAGICLLTRLTADTCRDVGESALAGKAELTGRMLLLLLSVPLFERVLTLIVGVVNGQAVTG